MRGNERSTQPAADAPPLMMKADVAPRAPVRRGPQPPAIQALHNRLIKTYRHWSRWARRRELGAFRCYDRDLPEFPLAIDCYVPEDGRRGARLHLQEIETGWVQDEAEHARWLAAVRTTVSQATGIPVRDVVCKRRPRRPEGLQHTKTGAAGEDFVVTEAGLRFWVNLEAYLDTGLFLDHRALRAHVRAAARGRRVLNLFAYTGSFTVYAAAGGAVASDSVDLSNTYLDWAARNFAANGLATAAHALVRADVLRWLPMAAAEGRRYDLIVLDPPAFSNSKAMSGVLDVQRDHPALITAARRLLGPGGTLFFSTNLRSFVLDPTLAAGGDCEDLSPAMRAKDFRDARVHHAFAFGGRGMAGASA